MRSVLVVAALVLGCTGEQVTPAQVDAATSSADSLVATDAPSSDAACPTYATNLIPDGDFSMGHGAWVPESATLELAAGPCTKALRLFNLTAPGRAIANYSGVPLKTTQKLHLRAWFKKGLDAPPGYAPSVFVRSYSAGPDGGEVYEDYSVSGTLTDEWRLSERVFNLKNDQTGMQVVVYAFLDVDGKTHDFLVADISLVVE